MALITFSGGVNNALRVERWAIDIWHTHQRDQFFVGDGLFGKGSNNVVQLKADLSRLV